MVAKVLLILTPLDQSRFYTESHTASATALNTARMAAVLPRASCVEGKIHVKV
jgi:hypothetical protein